LINQLKLKYFHCYAGKDLWDNWQEYKNTFRQLGPYPECHFLKQPSWWRMDSLSPHHQELHPDFQPSRSSASAHWDLLLQPPHPAVPYKIHHLRWMHWRPCSRGLRGVGIGENPADTRGFVSMQFGNFGMGLAFNVVGKPASFG